MKTALISNTKEMTPQVAARRAFEMLDACRRETLARDEEHRAIIGTDVPVHALQLSFRDGVVAITRQENRPGRAEEYFGKFLRSEMGNEAGAKELGRLKGEGFTRGEVKELKRQYKDFHRGRKKR